MKIELLEGDELFYPDGKARNIIVVIDGRRMIMPVDKTIGEVKEIVSRLGPAPDFLVISNGTDKAQPLTPTPVNVHTGISGQIEVNDIVRCVKAEQREDETTLVLGREYRILDIHKKEGVVIGYDIIDDKDPYRNSCKVDEVEFVRKGKRAVKAPGSYEAMWTCAQCKANKVKSPEMVLVLDGEKYRGICDTCKTLVEVDRELIAPKATDVKA